MKTITKKNIHILYIEDDEQSAQKLKNILEKFFSKVTTTANAKDTLEKLKNGANFDLIISDINMPRMDGLEFLEKLRAFDSSTPFVFITAREEPDMMFKAIQLDIENYILKPVNLQNLLEVINGIIDKKYNFNLNT